MSIKHPNPYPPTLFPPIQLSISIHNPLHESPIQFSPPSICSPQFLREQGSSHCNFFSSFSLSFPSSFHIFRSCFSLPAFLLPCTSWDNITPRTSLSRPKARSPSVPLSFNPSLWASPGDSDYNQVTVASAMPINVGGLKTEQGERGKTCPCPHLHTLPY